MSTLLPLIGLCALLVILGVKARQRRQEAKLGDMFKDAIKDKEYKTIIAGMVTIIILAVAYSLIAGAK